VSAKSDDFEHEGCARRLTCAAKPCLAQDLNLLGSVGECPLTLFEHFRWNLRCARRLFGAEGAIDHLLQFHFEGSRRKLRQNSRESFGAHHQRLRPE